MFDQPHAIFLMNLVQDVNILRPLVHMAVARDFRSTILISPRFAARDLYGIWQAELDDLQKATGATMHFYESDQETLRLLTGTGVIFAGSESSVPGHRETHDLFRFAPPGFLRVTLQHGFECVGFRHSAAHDRAYSHSASFAADILCAWQPPELLSALAPSQRPKVMVTGPTAALQQFPDPVTVEDRRAGLICENLHSVRLGTSAGLKNEFVTAFGEFCRLMDRERLPVALRPHPGGQYVLRKQVVMPINATIENAPIYRLDLRCFAFGISAPSSVLIDMLLAGIPTAVWRDDQGDIDTHNYRGLTVVTTPRQWLEFAREAMVNPQPFLDDQNRFLDAQQIPRRPQQVFDSFTRIFDAAERIAAPCVGSEAPRQRLLIVANARLPTLQVCIERPLMALIHAGHMAIDLLTETRLREKERLLDSPAALREWLFRELDALAPDTIMFSRYSGPFGPVLIEWARLRAVPVIYQIDDDLLAVPKELGERKHAYHNAPDRLAAVNSLLVGADLVYASTERLRERLLARNPELPVIAGPINCSGRVIRKPRPGPARVFGYMASTDHLPNLIMVLPAIIETLDRHPQLSFELFGSIPVPSELARFGARVRSIPAVLNYDKFLESLADRDWDMGICPLVRSDFNRCKSNNKWVEYTSLGIAVIASGAMIYDECCAGDCGLLAFDLEGWREALERLVSNADDRMAMAERAQQKLVMEFGPAQHRQQLLSIVEMARRRAGERPSPPQERS